MRLKRGHLRTPTPRAPLLLALLLALAASASNVPVEAQRQSGNTSARGQSEGDASQGFVSLALAPGGEVSVENRRGGVQVEVWAEDSVGVAASVAASASKGARGAKASARRKLPVSVERGEGSLVIKVERAATASAPRVDLRVRVPAGARLKVLTTDGALEIKGVPASLSAQTLSGDLRVELPAPADANVTAQSLNGSVAIGDGLERVGANGRTVRGKFQARLGGGGRVVNLFSGRGQISLTALAEGSVASSRAAQAGQTARTGERAPRVREEPYEAAGVNVRPRPPQAAETPQEVDEDEVVRVESDLVTLNVSVVDRASGRGLAGLSASDFRVYEDNVEQTVEHFESAEAPFDLLLLLDLSGSTARVTDTIRAAARRFVAATRPQDRIAIVTFAGDVNIVTDFTADRRALARGIERIAPPQGDTRLYDSLAAALEHTARSAEPARRRAVILMSDGLDSTLPNVTGTGSTLSFQEVRDRAQEFDGVLYTIWTDTEYEAFSPEDIQPETFDLARGRLEEFAGAGGGVFYEVEKLEDLAGAYERVVADLGTVYSLSYRPTNKVRDGAWRAIRVRLPRRADAVARGRRGYFAK